MARGPFEGFSDGRLVVAALFGMMKQEDGPGQEELSCEELVDTASTSVAPDRAPAPQAEPEAATGPTAEERIAILEADCARLRDQVLRTIAESQNIQRRMREQHADALKYATQPLVASLLSVLDNLERSVASLEMGASAEKVIEGVRTLDRMFRQALSSVNVERIASVGLAFDPTEHEAVSTTISEEHAESTVVAEIEPGYKMHGRVIRPARVQVSKKL